MTINIHLEPDEERAILERARLCGRDPAQYVQQLIRDHIQHGPSPGSAGNGASLEAATSLEDLIDHQFVAACARDNELDIPTIEEVRQGLAKIAGSLAQDIIAEREDRF
jgi:hypothetical protein